MVLLCTLFWCLCDHRLCFEGTLRGFPVGWELWGDLLSAFLPPGPMQTLGLSTPRLITALLAPTLKWGRPPWHFTLHCLKRKNKWNKLYTENPSFWITDVYPMGNQSALKRMQKNPWDFHHAQGGKEHILLSDQQKSLLKYPTAKLPCSSAAQNSHALGYSPTEQKGTALCSRRVLLPGKALLSLLSEPCRSTPNSRIMARAALWHWSMMSRICPRFRNTSLSFCHHQNNIYNITYIHSISYLRVILYMHRGIY